MITAILLMAASAGHSISKPVSFEANGKWILNKGENSCFLSRHLTGDGHNLQFSIIPHPGLPKADLVLQGSFPPFGKVGKRADIEFNASSSPFDGDIKTGPDGAEYLQQISVASKLLEEPNSSDTVNVSYKTGYQASMHLPGLPIGLKALKKCQSDLLQIWGVDEDRLRSFSPPGTPGFVDLSQWIRSDDFPMEARGISGKNVSLLSINSEGRVTGCRTIETSGNASLDNRSCKIAVDRFIYPPFHGKSGEAVASWAMYSVLWKSS